MIAAAGFLFGILIVESRKFLTDYNGPGGIKLAVVLAVLAGFGLGGLLARRLHWQDELEILIDRQAFAFAVNLAIFGLVALHLLEAAGFVPRFAWSTWEVLTGLGVLVFAGVLWSKLRYR